MGTWIGPSASFEGTATADLQTLHDIVKATLIGGVAPALAQAVQSFSIFARDVEKLSLIDRVAVFSMISNELARRALPNGGARDDFYDTNFGGSNGGGCLRRGW